MDVEVVEGAGRVVIIDHYHFRALGGYDGAKKAYLLLAEPVVVMERRERRHGISSVAGIIEVNNGVYLFLLLFLLAFALLPLGRLLGLLGFGLLLGVGSGAFLLLFLGSCLSGEPCLLLLGP